MGCMREGFALGGKPQRVLSALVDREVLNCPAEQLSNRCSRPEGLCLAFIDVNERDFDMPTAMGVEMPPAVFRAKVEIRGKLVIRVFLAEEYLLHFCAAEPSSLNKDEEDVMK
jgi:hypothetical protein